MSDFEIQESEKWIDVKYDLRVHGYLKTEEAPVISSDNGTIKISMMKFSLCPSWSKEFPTKFTTYNARMERESNGKIQRIYEVPSWKESFIKGQTCLVPMNAAIESSYFGKSAGNIIKFKKSNSELFYVAGLYSTWIDKSTGETHDTFTLITDDPYKYFLDHGHDRSVFVLGESSYKEWLLNNKFKPEERFNFLRTHRTSLDWSVEVDRPMKPGWEKRAPTPEEISKIKSW